MAKRALLVLTSTQKYPNLERATGLWFSEASHFYHQLHTHGWQIDFVSPRGGLTPIDPVSLQMGVTALDWQYYADSEFRNKLANTLKPSQVNPNDYQAIYYAGGHGVVFDFVDNEELQAIARSIYEKGGIVSGVCHGVVALLKLKLTNGQNLIKDKKVTGFSNEEEKMVQLDTHVPFLTEDELVKSGGKYQKGAAFVPYLVVDGRLITGQNPASSHLVGEAVVKHA